MKQTLHKLLAFTLLMMLALHVIAQQRFQNRRGPSLAFGVQVAQPLGQFAQQYDGFPVGLAGNFTAPIGRSPLEMGFGYAWNNMGSQTEDVAVFVGTDISGNNLYENGKMDIRSNTSRYHAIGRFRPFTGMIQPYVDGMAGMETYRTKTTIDVVKNNVGYSEGENAQTRQFDKTYSYGWAAGLRIRLAPGLFVDGRFESIIGGPAKYVDQNSIQISNGTDLQFQTKSSKTDKYVYQLGIAAIF